MENKQSQRTIYLKDLIFAILYNWKWIILVMLIGAIALGGLELTNSKDEVTLNTTSITPENQLKIDQLQAKKLRTEQHIAEQTAYLEESILMTLDPYAAHSAGVHICVFPQADFDDFSAGIARDFYYYLNSQAVIEDLSTVFDMDPRYFRELVYISIVDSNQLNITVRGRSIQEAKDIAAAFLKTAQDFKDSSTDLIGPHSVQFISFCNGTKLDTGLYDTQNAAHQKLVTMNNTLASTITELNKLLPTQLVPGKPQPLLFAVVGAFIGFCLVAAIACVAHIASARVYSARVLKDFTGLLILGRLNGRRRNPIDRWLRKLEGRATCSLTDIAAANIINHCKNVKTLLLLGCFDTNVLKPLTEELDQAGIQCTVCADPTSSAQAIKALPGCDAVVLVETCEKSTYDNVSWAMETISAHEKTLLGCVLIDG